MAVPKFGTGNLSTEYWEKERKKEKKEEKKRGEREGERERERMREFFFIPLIPNIYFYNSIKFSGVLSGETSPLCFQ